MCLKKMKEMEWVELDFVGFMNLFIYLFIFSCDKLSW